MKSLPMAIIRTLEQLKILSDTQVNELNKYVPRDINLNSRQNYNYADSPTLSFSIIRR